MIVVYLLIKRAIPFMRMALVFYYHFTDIPFSRRCLKETEQNNTENDRLFFHTLIFQRANIMIKIIFQNNEGKKVKRLKA